MSDLGPMALLSGENVYIDTAYASHTGGKFKTVIEMGATVCATLNIKKIYGS